MYGLELLAAVMIVFVCFLSVKKFFLGFALVIYTMEDYKPGPQIHRSPTTPSFSHGNAGDNASYVCNAGSDNHSMWYQAFRINYRFFLYRL